jgi:hypothetical protein
MKLDFSLASLLQVDIIQVLCHPLKFWTKEQLHGAMDLSFQSTLAMVQWLKIH